MKNRKFSQFKKASSIQQRRHDLSNSRDSCSTKSHLVCDDKENYLTVALSAGQEHETPYFHRRKLPLDRRRSPPYICITSSNTRLASSRNFATFITSSCSKSSPLNYGQTSLVKIKALGLESRTRFPGKIMRNGNFPTNRCFLAEYGKPGFRPQTMAVTGQSSHEVISGNSGNLLPLSYFLRAMAGRFD